MMLTGSERSRPSGALGPTSPRSNRTEPICFSAANKKSLTLNLRAPEGQKIFKDLARSADVVIENLRAGTMARYGLGYDDLRALNPRLVYCSVTGYGQTGSKRRHPSYDPVAQAASGMMSFNGTPETAPQKVGAPVTDCASDASRDVHRYLFQFQSLERCTL